MLYGFTHFPKNDYFYCYVFGVRGLEPNKDNKNFSYDFWL